MSSAAEVECKQPFGQIIATNLAPRNPTAFMRPNYPEATHRRLLHNGLDWDAIFRYVLPAFVGIVFLSCCIFADEDSVGRRRVLVIYSFSADSNVYSGFTEELHLVLKAPSAPPTEIYGEYLDLTRFADQEHRRQSVESLRRRYADRRPDLIILVSRPALEFGLSNRQELFPNTPIMFCAIDERMVPSELGSNVTGIKSRIDVRGSLQTALRLQPATQHVVFIGGTSAIEKKWEELIHGEIQDLESRVSITYLTHMSASELREAVAKLPEDTIIFLGAFFQDAAGEGFIPESFLSIVLPACNVPIYGTVYASYLGKGIVGGHMPDLSEHGKAAGALAARILGGESPDSIPVSFLDANVYMFDSRELKRWGIKERLLPPRSDVLFREPFEWSLRGWRVLIALAVCLLVASSLALFLRQSIQRRRAAAPLPDEKVRKAVDATPLMIWMSGIDRSAGYFNKPWYDFTGRRPTEQAGNGWDESVHPEDQERCRDSYANSFNARQTFLMEYRLRRSDGVYRWVLESGVPRFERDGSFVGFTGTCIDITEKRAAEESLRDLGGRLIQAQEEERSRIARDLHDDLSQRLALLSTDIEQFRLSASDISPDLLDGVRGALEQTHAVLTDLHRISHELHPSKLDRLGLVAASKSLCAEISGQQSLRIDFTFKDVPESIPREIALCLYRVLQESLLNVVKHSGAREAYVNLTGSDDGVTLSITDSGVGFDPKSPRSKGGLGLISMHERMGLVDGQISIESKPLQGTTVRASVPLVSGHAGENPGRDSSGRPS